MSARSRRKSSAGPVAKESDADTLRKACEIVLESMLEQTDLQSMRAFDTFRAWVRDRAGIREGLFAEAPEDIDRRAGVPVSRGLVAYPKGQGTLDVPVRVLFPQAVLFEHLHGRHMIDGSSLAAFQLNYTGEAGAPIRPPVARSIPRAALLHALAIEPCHTTGMHNPRHTTSYVCEGQRSAAFARVLELAGVTESDLPRRLHADCYSCHEVPAQEEHRAGMRALHAWAGQPVSDALAAPAPDAACFDVSEESIVAVLRRGEWMTSTDLGARMGLSNHTPHLRRPLDRLIASGRLVERRCPSWQVTLAEPYP